MVKTLVEQTTHLLDEAKQFLSEHKNEDARMKIIECHTLLAQVNGFKRADKDFLQARYLYQKSYDDLDYELLERGG